MNKAIGVTAMVVGAVFASGVLAADTEFKAQVRTRTEVDARDFNSDTATKLFTLQRTRLGVRLKSSDNVSAFFQIQDARTWGTETNTLKDASADQLDLHQGYFTIDELFDLPLSVRVGRMELIYGNERLVGAVGWSNTGRSFDGALLKLKRERLTLDLWATNVRDSSTIKSGAGRRDTDRYFFGTYGAYDWARAGGHSEFFVLADVDRDTIAAGPDAGDNKLARFTLGATHSTGYRGINATLEGGLQVGRTALTDSTQGDISAFFFAANVGYAIPSLSWEPWIGAGVDWLSGDGDPGDGDFEAFNTLFATNHKWYGYMDYFPANLGSLGLRDYTLKGRARPADAVEVAVNYHYFERDEEDVNGHRRFGHEVDSQVKYTRNANFSLQLGYSVFVRREVFEGPGMTDDGHWFYVMATANL